MTVAVLILGSGQVIAQLSNAKICYIVCFLIFTIVGMIAGLMRGLQHVGWLANSAVWMNICSFIIVYVPDCPEALMNVADLESFSSHSMVAAANFKVDYQATTENTRVHSIGPIKTFAGPPPAEYQPAATGFAGQLNGINQMVCTYSKLPFLAVDVLPG